MNKKVLSIITLSLFYPSISTSLPLIPDALILGDKVVLIAPSYKVTEQEVELAKKRITALGLVPSLPEDILQSDGCYGGTAQQRAKIINDAFQDPSCKAIFSIRGGTGSAQILALLDYELIKKNPKIFMGYSDITALLVAINTKIELVTFHGPMPAYPWPKFTVNQINNLFFNNEKIKWINEKISEDDLIATQKKIYTLNSGKARGKLIGGNLATLTALVGSDYLPIDWSNKILFLEEVEAGLDQVDRMMNQLKNSGILSKIKGFVFGTCLDCTKRCDGCADLEKMLSSYFSGTQIPAFSGAMIGHERKMFIMPIGALVEIDADNGSIELLDHVLKVRNPG